MSALVAARKGFWQIARPRAVRDLEQRIADLSPKGAKSWYYHLDFGYGVEVRPELRGDPYAGESNWRWLERHLPDLTGKRILDIGCNAGLYDLRMSESGAAEVIGVERDTRQAEFVKSWFEPRRGADFSGVRFLAADVRGLDLPALGRFDLACLFCVLYHLGEDADRVIGSLAGVADEVALQGNLPRTYGSKYRGRPYQELAGVEGMVEILERHGFGQLRIEAPDGHPKPLVIARSPAA